MKLIIFDIDQTLIDLIEYQRAATKKVFKELWNVMAKLDEVDFVGKTLHKNVVAIAKFHGISKEKVDEKIEQAAEIYNNYFLKELPDVSKDTLPGVKELLKQLSDKAYFLAVVTGNNQEVAEVILQKSGLRDYFHFLITGDMNDNRAELVHKAVLAAEQVENKKFDGVVIIGDSIEDIKSGKPYKATTIAVCTGFHSREKLEQEEPSYCFDNLSDVNKVLEAINGS